LVGSERNQIPNGEDGQMILAIAGARGTLLGVRPILTLGQSAGQSCIAK